MSGTTIYGEKATGWIGARADRDGYVGSLPTRAYRGIYRYFSFPIWSAGVSEEDLVFAMRVPFRWDGITNPHLYFITAPTAAETIDDRYQFQLKWTSADIGEVMPDTTKETLAHEVILATGTNAAFYAHILDFECDSTTMVKGQNMQAQLIRIDATASEVANEVAMFHWDTRWKINKNHTESETGY